MGKPFCADHPRRKKHAFSFSAEWRSEWCEYESMVMGWVTLAPDGRRWIRMHGLYGSVLFRWVVL